MWAVFLTPMTDLFDPTFRREGRVISPLTSTVLGSVPATAAFRSAALSTVTVGPPFPPVVGPIGLSFANPSTSQVARPLTSKPNGEALVVRVRGAMAQRKEAKLNRMLGRSLAVVTRTDVERTSSRRVAGDSRYLYWGRHDGRNS